jgi:MFS family permease
MSDEALKTVVDEDARRSRHLAVCLSAAAAAGAAGVGVSAFVMDQRTYGAPFAATMIIVAGFLLIAAVAVPFMVFALHRTRTRRWKRRQRECKELAVIAHTIHDTALGGLVSFNFRLMDRFVAVAIDQARTSFFACVAAATVALLVLLAGATTAVTVHGAAAQIVVGAITAIGAALSSYLSSTFLQTFQMTSKQMSYYYGQPLVHCYLLHAEWLGKRFEHDADPENRWKIRHELIRAVLDASREAQDHLLDLQLGTRRTPPAAPPLDLGLARSLLTPAGRNGEAHS